MAQNSIPERFKKIGKLESPVKFTQFKNKEEIVEALDEGGGLAVEDSFGSDDVSVFVHNGNVSLKSLSIGSDGEYAGIYWINGNVEIEGEFVFDQCDGAAIVYINGNLSAGSLKIADESILIVKGSLDCEEVEEDMSDMGALIVLEGDSDEDSEDEDEDDEEEED